ncbi:DJ-1/PfpI family protein [bacterium]|jgi:putative intracellular protease/amidase|nr:DJ-1/PfpI family protein [bacterium]MDB9797289.1 DJ-1/PfpI family protein [Pseudomonadales bacterium]|tara:strand:+ start:151 stop:768 length:618 start_codon:yes stop_codon:yes gene_type:complete
MRLGAVFYNDFELLDAYGPLEMFGALGDEIEIVTIAEQAGPVSSSAGPKTIADYGFNDAPELDLILLPGGIGTIPELGNEAMLTFLKTRAAKSQITMSVCTGSALLAKAGLLDGLAATTNKMFFELARSQSDQVDWQEAARWVDAGRYVTSSGVSAGTDMALAVIQRLFGPEAAQNVVNYTEYQWHQDAAKDPFESLLNQGQLPA